MEHSCSANFTNPASSSADARSAGNRNLPTISFFTSPVWPQFSASTMFTHHPSVWCSNKLPTATLTSKLPWSPIWRQCDALPHRVCSEAVPPAGHHLRLDQWAWSELAEAQLYMAMSQPLRFLLHLKHNSSLSMRKNGVMLVQTRRRKWAP